MNLRRLRNIRFFGWAACCAAALIIAGCEGRQETVASQAPPPPPVNVAVPIERTVQQFDEFTGHVAATETVDIRAQVTGYLEKVAFQGGAEVKKGDLLFQIDPRPFQVAVDRAQANIEKYTSLLATADRTLKEKLNMRSTGAASQKEVDDATDFRDTTQGNLASAKADLENAKINLGYASITSPIDGRTSRPLKTAGNLITPNTEMTTIVSMSPIYVYFDVDERTILAYRDIARARGQTSSISQAKIPVRVALADETNFPHGGFIDFINNEVDPQTGTINVRGLFDNTKRYLVPGQFVRVQVPRGDPAKALLVPDRAISRDQDRKYLLIVGNDDVVEYRPVQTGELSGDLRVIREGLRSGERVVVDGIQRARPGERVTAQLVEIKSGPTATAPSTAPTTSP